MKMKSRNAVDGADALSGVAVQMGLEDPRTLVAKAKSARLQTQIDSCKALEKQAFRLAELARESDLPFLVYLFDMARVAAVDERNRLGRQVSLLAGGR